MATRRIANPEPDPRAATVNAPEPNGQDGRAGTQRSNSRAVDGKGVTTTNLYIIISTVGTYA